MTIFISKDSHQLNSQLLESALVLSSEYNYEVENGTLGEFPKQWSSVIDKENKKTVFTFFKVSLLTHQEDQIKQSMRKTLVLKSLYAVIYRSPSKSKESHCCIQMPTDSKGAAATVQNALILGKTYWEK